jgi:hypothetical protein
LRIGRRGGGGPSFFFFQQKYAGAPSRRSPKGIIHHVTHIYKLKPNVCVFSLKRKKKKVGGKKRKTSLSKRIIF